MKKIILIGFFILFVIILVITVVLKVTDTSKLDKYFPLKVNILDIKGNVYIKKPSVDFVALDKNMYLEVGDVIKTGTNSSVEINFYDNSILRIGSDSEVLIQGILTEENKTKVSTVVKIKINVGRIWTRILKVLNNESFFEAETSNTVATVRGTAFDMIIINEKTIVYGIHNITDIFSKKNNESEFLLVNEKVTVDFTGKIVKEKIESQYYESLWYKYNINQDEIFKNDIQEKFAWQNKDVANLSKINFFNKIRFVAEKLRIYFSDNKIKQLVRFQKRRMAEKNELFGIVKEDEQDESIGETKILQIKDIIDDESSSRPINPLDNKISEVVSSTSSHSEEMEFKPADVPSEEEITEQVSAELNTVPLNQAEELKQTEELNSVDNQFVETENSSDESVINDDTNNESNDLNNTTKSESIILDAVPDNTYASDSPTFFKILEEIPTLFEPIINNSLRLEPVLPLNRVK